MKRTWKIGLTAVLLAIVAGAYFSWPGHAPAGQPILIELDGKAIPALQPEFNRAAAGLRVILLLSPT
jgi:hypothetical protein